MRKKFQERLAQLEREHVTLLALKNEPEHESNGVFNRYHYPVLTAKHTPLFWRYDLNAESNPFLMERFGINAVLNAGAIKWNNKYLLMPRVECIDRKSFFWYCRK